MPLEEHALAAAVAQRVVPERCLVGLEGDDECRRVGGLPAAAPPPPPEPEQALSARADTATAAMTAAPRAVVIRDILISCDRRVLVRTSVVADRESGGDPSVQS